MNDRSKSVANRPKVRFSQSVECSNDARAFTKPRVTSVIDFKRPCVKIVKSGDCGSEKNSTAKLMETNLSGGDAPNDLRLCPKKSACESPPSLTEIVLTPENGALKTTNFAETKERRKSVARKVPTEKISPPVKSIGAKTSKSLPTLEKSRRSKSTTSRDDKENVCELVESTRNVSPAVDVDSKGDGASKVSSSATEVPPPVKKAIESCRSHPRRSVKAIGLMPCMRASKVRSKSDPIKKTFVRDASSSRSNIYVGPGVPRSEPSELEAGPSRPEARRSRSDILSGNRLARPEYNSIAGTMRKLRDLRECKAVKDLQNLPSVYKGLVNGKVSSVLDFGANEAIYRDLVDLTIDEKQLPTRLTRSKDPEPRQKDLVPRLSDFFKPTNDDEYRRAVIPRPPSPRILDTSNPYRISDRIFAWKESLDHDS